VPAGVKHFFGTPRLFVIDISRLLLKIAEKQWSPARKGSIRERPRGQEKAKEGQGSQLSFPKQ
jgi:hypothetical protein